jgi:threonine dehydrogenase-like Zn-dependent dehydrogenase
MVHFREASGSINHWGHEIVGRIETVAPDIDDSLLGRAVTVRTSRPCMQCSECQRGLHERCSNWSRHAFNGFSEYITVPIPLLALLPRPYRSTFVLTEPLYVAMDLVEKSNLRAGESAMIIGVGPISLMVLYLLRKQGVEPGYVVYRVHSHSGRERSVARRELARRWGGVVMTTEGLDQHTERHFCHAALVTAPYSVVPSVISAVRYAGRIVYNGISSQQVVALNLHQIHTRKIWLVPSFPHPQTSFAAAMAEISSNFSRFDELISHRIQLESAPDAFALLSGDLATAIKVVLEA